MQYFKPEGDFFVGDCMPFFYDGMFRLFYLLDENHHEALGGLGGHQWAQASSRDLIHWEHHPLAIPITQDDEGSICTGSVIFHEGVFYGFYATRRRDWTQHLSLATSQDGIHFEKISPNPLASPPAGYDPVHFRDPAVFQDRSGLFHLLVTACLTGWSIPGRGGCLAHLVSADLIQWEHRDPFIIPGLIGVPECPDYFEWNGWYYLVFSNEGIARYRMSPAPFGPWLRPKVDMLDGPVARVMKTASFGECRRLGVAWIGTRRNGKDNGPFQFGGNALFRELVQHNDGTLGAKFPEEMISRGEPCPDLHLSALSAEAKVQGFQIDLAAWHGLAAAACTGLPNNARLKIRFFPQPGSAGFGLCLRASGQFDSGYQLHFSPYKSSVRLNDQRLFGMDSLDRPFNLEIFLMGELIDVCIDNRRTLIDRCPERHGDQLLFYAQDAEVRFEVVEVEALR